MSALDVSDTSSEGLDDDQSPISAYYVENGRRREVSDLDEGGEEKDKSECCGPCARLMDWLRGKYWFHLIAFLAHYLGLLAAIFATIASYFFHTSITSASGLLNILIVVGIIVDIVLLDKHYKEQTFFPYCAAPHLLFMTKGIRCDPCPPPKGRLYISQKLLIFWQGYIFVVVPYNNLIRSLQAAKGRDHTDIEKTILIVTLIQLAITIVGVVLFAGFYIAFVLEIIVRFFGCPCLQYREAEQRYKTIRKHFMASDYRDPWFYTVYAWLFENL